MYGIASPSPNIRFIIALVSEKIAWENFAGGEGDSVCQIGRARVIQNSGEGISMVCEGSSHACEGNSSLGDHALRTFSITYILLYPHPS